MTIDKAPFFTGERSIGTGKTQTRKLSNRNGENEA